MEKQDIKLTGNTVKNIQAMAPLLTRKDSYIVFGVALGLVSGNMPIGKENGNAKSKTNTGRRKKPDSEVNYL